MPKQFCLLLLLFSLVKPLSAQTSPELVLDDVIGSPLQGQITWLDDERLLVGTSSETRLYEPASSLEAVYTIPAGGNYFLMNDEIIVGGQRWNSTTGEALGTSNVVKTWANDSGSLRANLLNDGRAEIIGESVHEVPIPEGYTFSNIVFSPDEINAVVVFRRPDWGYMYEEIAELWNLSHFEKIADLSNSAGLELLGAINFFQAGQRLVISYSTFAQYGSIFAETVIWDTATGQRLNEDNDGYMRVHLSPDKQFLVLVDIFYLEVWGMDRLGRMGEVDGCEGCTADYTDATFSADGQFLAASQVAGISLWNLSHLREGVLPSEPIIQTNDENRDYNYSLSIIFSPDSQTFLRWGGDIEVWDITTKEEITHLSIGTGIYDLKFSPDGRWLRISTNGEWQIYDTRTWSLYTHFPVNALPNPSWTSAAYWSGGDIALYNLETQSSQTLPIIADFRGVVLGMNTNEEWLLFQSNELYGLRDDTLIFSFPQDEAITLSEDSPYFLSTHRENDELIHASIFLDSAGIHELARLQSPPYGFGNPIISADGRTVSSLGRSCGDGGGGSQSVWHGQEVDDEMPRFMAGGDSCGPYDHVFSPDGKMLISAWDDVLIALDISQETLLTGDFNSAVPSGIYFDTQFRRENSSLDISPDNQYLAWSADACVYNPDGCVSMTRTDILRINTSPATPDDFAELLFSIPDASHALFSPDSRFILTSTGLWSIEGAEIMPLANEAADFDPSGRWLVTYSENELFLWDWAQVQTGNAEALYRLPIDGVKRLAFNADGSFLYAQRQGDVQRIRIQIESN